MDDDQFTPLAHGLMAQAGLAAPVAVERLSGGKNNRVFKAATAAGECFIIKSYFHDAADPRDRLAAEWAFLSYADELGLNVPRPLAQDHALRVALYSYMPGRKLRRTELGEAHVQAAADFIVAINGSPARRATFAPGSEACFSLAEHVATIDRRVARLHRLDPQAPLGEAARQLVDTALLPRWNATRAALMQQMAALGDPLPLARQCLSPSDFGFHNALVDDAGTTGFIDFEYAGRDDPAKLVCDFFNQPEIPVPLKYYDAFIQTVGSALELTADDLARCALLLDAYRIKWSCIMLNDFLPDAAARRSFALQDAREQRCREQLAKVEASLAPPAFA